ncbi:MAG: aminoglycoside phosphotransferase family protein [Bacteroidota bacterium]
MKEDRTVLKGGMSAREVVKIGDRVHRTASSRAAFVHKVLGHLEDAGFAYAPRFLDIDEEGREILTFIVGEVPREIPLTFPQKVEAMKILRGLHDCLATSNLKGTYETICHHDFAPWNVIVNQGRVVGVIDFDEAAPGNRIDDVAYFIWTFLDLGVSEDSDEVQIKHIGELMDAYRLENRAAWVPAIVLQQKKIQDFRQQIVSEGQDPDLVAFSKNALINIQKSIAWVHTHRERIINS